MDKKYISGYISDSNCVIIENVSDRLFMDPLEVMEFYYNSETYKRFLESESPLDFPPGALIRSVIGEILGKEVNVVLDNGLKVSTL